MVFVWVSGAAGGEGANRVAATKDGSTQQRHSKQTQRTQQPADEHANKWQQRMRAEMMHLVCCFNCVAGAVCAC